MVLNHDPDGTVLSPAVLVIARRDVDLPVVIEDIGRTWTWRDLSAYAEAVAAQLPGVDGERVTVTAPNNAAFIAAIFGVWQAGGVPVPLSYRLPAEERARILATLGARKHIAWSDLGLEADVQIDAETGNHRADAAPVVPRRGLQEPGIVLCTSGTTGQPKAITHSIRAVWGLVDGVVSRPVDPAVLPVPRNGPPRRIEPKPLAHIGALFGLVMDLWRGRSIVLMHRFEPHAYVELLRTYDIEMLSLVPSMVRMMLDSDVDRLKPPATLLTTGTAALPPAWREEFESRFGVPVQVTYGQTESCGAIAYEPMDDIMHGTRREGTAGRVIPQIAIAIRDDDRVPLPTGSVGHIWISGETLRPVMSGDPTERFVDGWLDTGDLGWLDQDRYVYITGRDREMIVRGGLKVFPAEVENTLLAHPDVVEVAVAGRPDERLGEVPVAWVRLNDGAAFDADALIAFVRSRLVAYKVPVAIHAVTAFPRTDSGKIRKHELASATLAEPA